MEARRWTKGEGYTKERTLKTFFKCPLEESNKCFVIHNTNNCREPIRSPMLCQDKNSRLFMLLTFASLLWYIDVFF